MDAVLNIGKPPGMTSFAAVSAVRKLARATRAGHAGTLDPMADGVLLVLLGRATRAARYFEALPKRYRASVRLGVETDTYDTTGRVRAERPVPDLDHAAVRALLLEFTGDIMQVPPMFSALKKDGRPLYELARRGIEVDRGPRPVSVHSLELVSIDGALLVIDVRCSKGTYIRALAHDIGARMGCGGAVERLTRLAVGGFTSELALDLARADAAAVAARALDLNTALGFLPALALDPAQARAVRHGNQFSAASAAGAGEPVRLVHDGTLLAIGMARPGPAIHPDVVFAG